MKYLKTFENKYDLQPKLWQLRNDLEDIFIDLIQDERYTIGFSVNTPGSNMSSVSVYIEKKNGGYFKYIEEEHGDIIRSYNYSMLNNIDTKFEVVCDFSGSQRWESVRICDEKIYVGIRI